MRTLSEATDYELPLLLTPLVEAYEAWIDAQQARIGDPAARLDEHEATARRHVENARQTSTRIRRGIKALFDTDVAKAFRFANHAMWQQRVQTVGGSWDPEEGDASAD